MMITEYGNNYYQSQYQQEEEYEDDEGYEDEEQEYYDEEGSIEPIFFSYWFSLWETTT
jgi:hypothetical protein